MLGGGFLIGQWIAWRVLADRGFYLATSASSSFVYLLTATHAVHLVGGMLVLLYAALLLALNLAVDFAHCLLDPRVRYD